MFKKWRERRAKRKALRKQAEQDAYMERLRYSAYNLSGLQYIGDGPTLSIREVELLIWREVERRQQEDVQ